MECAMANPYEPDFGIWVLCKETIRSGLGGIIDSTGTSLDIDCDDLPIISCLHLAPHVSLIDFVATPGGFLSRVSWLLP